MKLLAATLLYMSRVSALCGITNHQHVYHDYHHCNGVIIVRIFVIIVIRYEIMSLDIILH